MRGFERAWRALWPFCLLAGVLGGALLLGAAAIVGPIQQVSCPAGQFVNAVDLTSSCGTPSAFQTVLGAGRTVAGTSDTLAASDCGKVVVYTSGSPVTVTTVAAVVSSSQICAIGVYQRGAGLVTIADGAGATHVSQAACTKSSGQYALLSLAVYGQAGISEYNIGGQCQ